MDQRQLFLRDVLAVLFKRMVLIVLFALIVFAVVFAGNYVWPPTYESAAKVRLMEGREQLVADPTVTRSAAEMTMVQMSIEDVNSEIELIYSDDVLASVAEKLDLANEPIMDAGPVQGVLRAGKGAFDQVLYVLALKKKPTKEQMVVDALRRAVQVNPIEKSYVMEVVLRWRTPERAQEILETLLEEFEAKHLEVYAQPESQPFFREQYKRVQDELAQAQSELEKFRNENKLLEVDVEKELLLDQYNRAKRLLLQLEELGGVTEGATQAEDSGHIVAVLSRETESILVNELRLKLLEKVQRRDEITQSKGPRHPDRIAINNEIEKAVTDLKQALALSMQSTQKQVSEYEARLKQLNELMGRYDELKLEVKTKTDSLEYYAEKLEESIVADAVSKFKISSVRVISSPSMPTDPVSPRRMFNLLVALAVGITGGIALAFFLEYLDHGLKTPEDVEHYLNAPPLASYFHTPHEQLDLNESQRLSAMIEAVHPNGGLQVVEVASSVGGEGSHRVARALAEAGSEDPDRRVLLVDFVGDGIQEVPSGPGLTDVLSGTAELADVVSSMGGLFVVGRGSLRDCPTYLWRSQRMTELLSELKQRFDQIVFHVPPVLSSHDGVNLARLADGIVLVVRADSTRREVVLRAMEMLAEAKGHVLGVVMTERRQVIPKIVYRRI